MNGSAKTYIIEVRGVSVQNLSSASEIRRQERKIQRELDQLVRDYWKVGPHSKAVVSRVVETKE